MTIVGMAEVIVRANTAGFKKQLEESTAPAFSGLRKDAQTAGEDAGVGLRSGVHKEAGKLEADLGKVGAASGVSLRKGVAGETGKVADDVGKAGARSGEGFAKGMSGGLSKLGTVLTAVGAPIGGLQARAEHLGTTIESVAPKATHTSGALNELGKNALLGVGAGFLGAAAAGVHFGEAMQSADAKVAAASGTSVTAASKIGDAFLATGGKSEFSGQEIATAYAAVAGVLKSTEGHVLSTAEATKVMGAADDLATAKQIDLGTATQATAGIMQAFQLKAGDAAHVTDVLYTASTATGTSIGTLSNQLEKIHSKLGETGGSIGDLTGLLVDMTNQGITGRAAMGALNAGMNTLQKTATGVTKATADQKAAYQQMSPSLQALAGQYRSGAITSAQFTKATAALPPEQAALAKSFATASTAVQTAQVKYRELGVTVFDASGKFVGMGSIIAQLHPKFAAMTQAQQLAAASTLFGAGAARQMTQVINAGPAAYQKATASVNKMGAAHDAAAKQAKTLHVEMKVLKAEGEDLAAKIGAVLIPIFTALVGGLIKATSFVTHHKVVLIALAAVVTGVLGTAIAVFTVNKMAAFGKSFTDAAGHVSTLLGKLPGLGAGIGAVGVKAEATGVEMAAVGVEAEASAVGVKALGVSAAAAGGGFDIMAVAAAALDAIPLVAVIAGIALAIAALVVGIVELANHWKAVWHAIEDAVKAAVGFITGLFSKLPGELLKFVEKIASGIATVWKHVERLTSEVVTAIVGFFSKLPGELLTLFQHIVGDVAHVFASILSDAGKLISSIVGFFAALPGKIVSGIGSLVGDVAHVFASILSDAGKLIGDVVGFFAGLPGKIMSAIGSLVDDFVSLGGKLISAIVSGIEAAPGAIIGAVESLIPGPLKSVLSVVGLADGGIVTRPTLAVVGEAGPEAVVPLGKIAFAGDHVQALPTQVATDMRHAPAAHHTAAHHTAAHHTAAHHAAASHTAVSQAAGQQAADRKWWAKQQVADQKAGTTDLNNMLAAIHSGSLTTLQGILSTQQNASLKQTESNLSYDHSSALTALSRQLIAVHRDAMAALVQAHQTAALNTQSTQLATAAKYQADEISGSTKVSLDQQAAAGLAGAARITADAQTNLDLLTQRNNQAIDQAQIGIDSAAGGSPLEQAQAANTLARAQATATITQAQAQSVLDRATAAAAGAGGGGGQSGAVFHFTINGANMSAAELMTEVGWSLKTGTLPTAAPA